jgi:hypothetical protein
MRLPAFSGRTSDNFEHGLSERIPIRSFYEGLDHVYTLAVALGEAKLG